MTLSAKRLAKAFSLLYRGRLDTDKAYVFYLEFCHNIGHSGGDKDEYLKAVKK